MNIDVNKLHTLWYQDDQGNKWIPPKDGEMHDPPPGFMYQHARWPNVLQERVERIVQADEVAECQHEAEYVVPTYGWIDEVEGRECRMCKGTQVKQKTEPWPEKWDAAGSRTWMTMNNSFSEELALAIAGKGDTFTLGQAIMITALACERCMNSLAHQYGFDWGYAEYSEDWQKSGTECLFCVGEPLESVPPATH